MVRWSMSILLIVSLHWMVSAQFDAENFIRYTSGDGLSDNFVTSVQQDSFGFMWIGTENGLNRFDGHSFKNYFFGSPSGFLRSSTIRKLIHFSEHELGIVSAGGFQILDPLTMQMRDFIIPDTTAFVVMRNSASDATLLSGGQIAVTTNSGFYVFNPDQTLDFRYDAYNINDNGNQSIRYGRQVLRSGGGVMIYHDNKDIAHYDTSTKTYTHIDTGDTNWAPFVDKGIGRNVFWTVKSEIAPDEFIFLNIADSLVYYNSADDILVSSPLPFHWEEQFSWSSKIISVNDSTLVITGGYAGFYFLKLDPRTKRITFQSPCLLPEYKIFSLFVDRENRYWFGTRTGLLKQIINEPWIERFSWPDTSDRSSGFTDALIHNDVLYLSRLNSASGLMAFDLKSMQRTKSYDFGHYLYNNIYSIEMYHPDTLLMGNSKEMLWLDTKTNSRGRVKDLFPHDTAKFLYTLLSPAVKGKAWWILQLGGAALEYDLAKRSFKNFTKNSDPAIPYHMIKHVAHDAYDDVWLGGHSMARWSHTDQKFDTLFLSYEGPNKYNENVLTMVSDSEGALWFHNGENGLLQYKIREKTYRHFSMKDGLPSNTIIALSPVIDDYLFIMTPHHLVRMDTRSFGFEIFGNETDLPSELSIARNMYWDEGGQKMYAFYKDEIIRFPLHRPATIMEGTDIIIQELVINNEIKKFYPGNHIDLKPSQNNISIEYTVVDFEQSKDYQFAFNLDNAKEWTSVASQRAIHFNKLNPGEHTLQIRATGKSGRQKVTTFTIIVQQPFWNQAWFVPAMAMLLSLIIYLIFRSREAGIREKANLDKQIAEAEMKALHAQMNPHFIFNSLNSIREMVLQNEVSEASRYLSEFAHLIRMTLNQSIQTFVTLRSTMEYLTAYVKMEQIRKNNFTFQLHADPELDPDETPIPPMLIQPFIENAIWHGDGGSKCNINIRLTFERLNEHLLCTIEDDGVGISKSKEKKNGSKAHLSVGINNIRTRIDLLNQKHHLKSTIDIVDKAVTYSENGSGTLVRIILPLEIRD